MKKLLTALSALLFSIVLSAQEQTPTSTEIGNYVVYHTIFNSSFLTPEVAAAYDLIRGKGKGIINLSVTNAETSSYGLPAEVSGEARNLMQQLTALNFIEIQEQNATYYIAPFDFIDQEIMNFNLQVVLPGNTRATDIRLSKKMYENL